MSFENVNLWFAKDKNNEIMMIKDIIEENKHNEYTCPICGGLVRANTGTIKSWYFSHINADDCSSETIVHWFVKHELLKVGEKFKVKINDDIEEYVCKEIIEEKEYNTKYGVYRPDLTVVTTTNEIIYIEVANTNGKKIKDFIDMWKELGNTVIEFKVGEVLNGNKIEVFNSIWYVGKEYNEQLKELKQVCDKEKEKYEFTKEQVEQIDWLIDDICKYNNELIEIDELSDEIQAIKNENQRQLVCNIVRNKKCGSVLEDYIEYNENKIYEIYDAIYSSGILYSPNSIYNKLYGEYTLRIKVFNEYITSKINIVYPNDLNILINNIKFLIGHLFKINYIKYLSKYSYEINGEYIHIYSKKYILKDILLELINRSEHSSRIKNITYIRLVNLEEYLYSTIDKIEENEYKKLKKYNLKRRILNRIINKTCYDKCLENIILYDKKNNEINIIDYEVESEYFIKLFKIKNNKFKNNILFDNLKINIVISDYYPYNKVIHIIYGNVNTYVSLKLGYIGAINTINNIMEMENEKNKYYYIKEKINKILKEKVIGKPKITIEEDIVRVFIFNKKVGYYNIIGKFCINNDSEKEIMENISCIIRKYKYPNWEADN